MIKLLGKNMLMSNHNKEWMLRLLSGLVLILFPTKSHLHICDFFYFLFFLSHLHICDLLKLNSQLKYMCRITRIYIFFFLTLIDKKNICAPLLWYSTLAANSSYK